MRFSIIAAFMLPLAALALFTAPLEFQEPLGKIKKGIDDATTALSRRDASTLGITNVGGVSNFLTNKNFDRLLGNVDSQLSTKGGPADPTRDLNSIEIAINSTTTGIDNAPPNLTQPVQSALNDANKALVGALAGIKETRDIFKQLSKGK